MRLPSASPLRFLVLLSTLFGLFATSSRADLVWDPQSGWRVEGGALAGLAGNDGRKALDLMNSARKSEEAGSRRSAIRAYGNLAKKYPNSIYAPEALYRSAHLRLAGRDFQKAFEDFQGVVGRYPNTKCFNEMLWGLLPGFRARDKALEFFETILVNAPYSDYAPLSLMNIARGHQKLNQIEDAIDALDRMVNNYPQSLLAPDAYLKLGQTHATLVDGPYYDQAATNEAITYFTDFMLLFPSDAGVAAAEKGLDGMKNMLAESKMKIGDFYFYKRSNYTAAKVFYNEAITSYPESPIAGRAKLRLVDVEAKASGKKVAPEGKAEGDAPKKKRFWFF
jgi:outer membrane protein assembly factor BamD